MRVGDNVIVQMARPTETDMKATLRRDVATPSRVVA